MFLVIFSDKKTMVMKCSFKQRLLREWRLRVETRTALLDEKHLEDKTIKFSSALLRGSCLHELSKGVYRSQSFYVQQYVARGVARAVKPT